MSMTETGLNQRALSLRVEQRTVLVTVDAVRGKFVCDAESVWAMVDNGELRWAFDVALGLGGSSSSSSSNHKRKLRFWTRELIAPETTRGLELDAVVASILGVHRTELRRGEIERQWIVSAQHVMRLVKSGQLKLSRPGHITRASAAAFLKARIQS